MIKLLKFTYMFLVVYFVYLIKQIFYYKEKTLVSI